MDRIAHAFREDFANWGLDLPTADLQMRRSGFIQAKGWLIQYTFGRNRFGQYLDYYAAHRMTGDQHVRLYSSGRRQHLTALASMYLTSEDPEDAARLEAAYIRRNRRIARALVSKGFSRFTINMVLHAGLAHNGELPAKESLHPMGPNTRLQPPKPRRRRKSRGKRSARRGPPRLRG